MIVTGVAAVIRKVPRTEAVDETGAAATFKELVAVTGPLVASPTAATPVAVPT